MKTKHMFAGFEAEVDQVWECKGVGISGKIIGFNSYGYPVIEMLQDSPGFHKGNVEILTNQDWTPVPKKSIVEYQIFQCLVGSKSVHVFSGLALSSAQESPKTWKALSPVMQFEYQENSNDSH